MESVFCLLSDFCLEVYIKNLDNDKTVRIFLDVYFQKVKKRLFVLAFNVTTVNDDNNPNKNTNNRVKKRVTENTFFQE